MEYEIKLKAGPEGNAALRSDDGLNALAAGPWEETPMETSYYRDADGRLAAAKVMLRQRREGGREMVTCKAPSSHPHAREEYELECGSIDEAIPLLIDQGAPDFLRELKGLESFCGAKFTRQALLLQLDGCKAELALDKGCFFREGRTKDFELVELELKEGSPADMEALAKTLELRFGLKPEPRSKLAQAMDV